MHYIPTIDRTYGGTTAYLQLLANELGKLVELHVVTHRTLHPVEMKNCRIHYIASSVIGAMKNDWQNLLKLIQPDVVHINCCWTPGCAFAQKWAQQLGFKVVLTPHGMLEPWIMSRHYWTRKLPGLWLYQKQAIVKADCLHATAESEKENLLKLGYNDKIAVVANGIDVDSIEMKATWKRKNTILFLSRVHVKKGANFLIEAVAHLKDELQGYVVNIAGEGDEGYIAELKAQALKQGVGEMMNFRGGVYGDEKWQLFKNADLFVLPTYSENFGIVVAEALACGTPVITTKGTPWQDLEDCHCGWWTEIGTDAIIETLRRFLILNDDELEVMGRNGRKLVEEEYSAEKMAKDMMGVYNSLCTIGKTQ